MLLRLTGIAQPDLNQGKPPAVYIETMQILSLTLAVVRPQMIAAVDDRFEMLEEFWLGVQRLTDKVNGIQPDLENPVAAGWMMQCRTVVQETMQLYQLANKTDRNKYQHRVECTEISLTSKAESGNILRVWCVESPDEIVARIAMPFPNAGATYTGMRPGQVAHGMPARIDSADAKGGQ